MELTGKKEWKWKDEEKDTFNKPKNKIMNPPILAIPDSKRKYHKWSLTICDGYFDTLKSSKMRS